VTRRAAFGRAAAKDCAMVTIRHERPGDVPAREVLLDLAFGAARFAKASERLREGRRPAKGLAFVALDAGRVVGSVRLWTVVAGAGKQTPLPALLLGPLAVDPAHRGRGIGAALMRRALWEARRLGHGAVLLVGDAPYYGRFGFSAAATASLRMPGAYAPERLLALELRPGAIAGAAGLIAPADAVAGTAAARVARPTRRHGNLPQAA
jgi:predicted N-acetyltransferase YhbS